MKKVLIIDNFDSFTFNLVDYFKQLKCKVIILRNNIDPSEVSEIKPDLIVISPGPSIPKNAGNLMEIIEQNHKTTPIFGVCLGHEAIIEHFEGTIKHTTPVHGKSSKIHHNSKGIFKDLPQDFSAGRYHSLIADHIPSCLNIIAKTDKLVMAIQHKSLPIFGVQFHPESILTMKNETGLKLIKNLLTCI